MSAGQQSPLNASVLNHQTTEESKPNFYKELEEDTNRLHQIKDNQTDVFVFVLML